MARLPLQAEGNTKKHAVRELNRKLTHAEQAFGVFKDGKTLFTARNGKVVAVCCVHS